MQDFIIASMPLRKNVPHPKHDWIPMTCPVCGAACWHNDAADEELEEFRRLGGKVIEMCTECMLKHQIGGKHGT